MSDFRNQVDALSVAEKAELLDAVWESLEADMPALTDEQRAELDDRMARYARNPETVIPWEKVRTGMFKRG